eukprot:302515-Amphidinium_carterae.1
MSGHLVLIFRADLRCGELYQGGTLQRVVSALYKMLLVGFGLPLGPSRTMDSASTDNLVQCCLSRGKAKHKCKIDISSDLALVPQDHQKDSIVSQRMSLKPPRPHRSEILKQRTPCAMVKN